MKQTDVVSPPLWRGNVRSLTQPRVFLKTLSSLQTAGCSGRRHTLSGRTLINPLLLQDLGNQGQTVFLGTHAQPVPWKKRSKWYLNRPGILDDVKCKGISYWAIYAVAKELSITQLSQGNLYNMSKCSNIGARVHGNTTVGLLIEPPSTEHFDRRLL